MSLRVAGLGACLLALSALAGCGDDDAPAADAGTDAGELRVDAGPPDAGTWDADLGPRCGNAHLDPGESCDDGNAIAGDGCTLECHFEPFCGDGVRQDAEVCDDGNGRDGDGCAADCAGLETCGDGSLDLARGETCDDHGVTAGDGCDASCRQERCGNGTLDVASGEVCDDANAARWDACGPDCRPESDAVVDSLSIGDRAAGCDLNHDGAIDNVFTRALGSVRGVLNDQLAVSLTNGRLRLLLGLSDLDDATATSDPRVWVGIMVGVDSNADPTDDFSGDAALLAWQGSLDATTGEPTELFHGAITSSMLAAGPADIRLPLVVNSAYELPLALRRAELAATTSAATGALARVTDGTLCGAVPPDALLGPSPLSLIPGSADVACDGSMPRFLDVIVGGALVLGVRTFAVRPDVDLDGDGLETYEVRSMGPAGCQPVVSACIDGDGTRVEGRDCAGTAAMPSLRFVDGFSAALELTAVRARIVGTSATR